MNSTALTFLRETPRQHALSDAWSMPYVDYQALMAHTAAFDVVPFVEASQRRCVAVRQPDGYLLVLCEGFSPDTLSWLEQRVIERGEDTPFDFVITAAEDLDAYLSQQEASLRAIDSVAALDDVDPLQADIALGDEISLAGISQAQSAVVRLIDSTLYDALKAQASDIHFETFSAGLAIKYRIDGVLIPIKQVAGVQLANQVISRTKVLSQLDIAERRVPQDGRYRAKIGGREIDFRVSVMPSALGEDVVIRILDKHTLASALEGLTLEGLGFEAAMIEEIRTLAAQPYGMLLVTGPTGSGKTTTLYAVISEVNRGEDKIITIEDPVEYQLPGVLQIPVNEAKGLTFARGLRSVLRHDPDRIMVGEIRDQETAEIAIQASLTGHTVFTTVHANNVLDVVGRFLHMKVDLYSFSSAVNAIMAQRLVRMNCLHCIAPYQPSSALLRRSRLPENRPLDAFDFRKGQGCAHCRGSGYRGRRAIIELLVMTDALRAAIVGRIPADQLKDLARRSGLRPLRDAVLELVAAGTTSLEEANRVTFVD
jgi:general secretion pathway protein E